MSNLQTKPSKQQWTQLKEWIAVPLFFIIVFSVVGIFIARPIEIVGSSMEPTLEDEQWTIGNKISWLWDPLMNEDVIVFASQGVDDFILVKRIIGVAGDVVEIKEGVVYINEVLIEEPYLKKGELTLGEMKVTVPPGHFFVLGDNRQNSGDSRNETIGFVKKEWILARLWGY